MRKHDGSETHGHDGPGKPASPHTRHGALTHPHRLTGSKLANNTNHKACEEGNDSQKGGNLNPGHDTCAKRTRTTLTHEFVHLLQRLCATVDSPSPCAAARWIAVARAAFIPQLIAGIYFSTMRVWANAPGLARP